MSKNSEIKKKESLVSLGKELKKIHDINIENKDNNDCNVNYTCKTFYEFYTNFLF